MTSTNFNANHIEGKPSSRVLRPPGGGHTDIFGINKEHEIRTPQRRNQHTSSINSCFGMDEQKSNGEIIEPKKNGHDNGELFDENQLSEAKEAGKQDISETDQPATPLRARVPPGGYSAGFW